MNQKHLLTVVAVFTAVFGIQSVGRAQTTKEMSPALPLASSDVVKVGEYKSQAENLTSKAVMTEIHTHEVAGRQAATLYIRNIPVLTFLGQNVGNKPAASAQIKVGAFSDEDSTEDASSPTKVASIGASIGASIDVKNQANYTKNDPVQRASRVAAKINQLIWDKVDANKITVSWKAGGESTANQAQKNDQAGQQLQQGRYIIKANGNEIVEIDDDTRLAQTTKDRAKDALQATNRLRRLVGNASPLNEIADLPTRSPVSISKLPQIIARRVRGGSGGMASYYGYDGSGNRTATGERFNPEGMTAAHRSLPFGTRVRVTNTRNGRSVVVRINDRGPFIRGRIIDLSVAAARILGMMGSGVAPVRIEVIGR
ncbi:septal ring lytic transglycosylase RlpA family protein [Brasilonema sp. UFV-L1]|uniref:septal ring lytic transglycosylase RlpA family protein n=1 Tax=Brasilonema sp. UFV-L1 TaxID=2234130 RepID=UPI00145EED1F|nr:septal ring lytic transglycosylase RlpA family protein [Brasilonema sp. UFV-L1]NMG06617.1 septal ring lytic transglycosylase RlpA family protein [Brasilonema sp. UFV-L1]